jgi:hypothetical protein
LFELEVKAEAIVDHLVPIAWPAWEELLSGHENNWEVGWNRAVTQSHVLWPVQPRQNIEQG